MNKLVLAFAVLTSLFWTLSTRAAAPPGSTTTRLAVPVSQYIGSPPGGCYGILAGGLDVTFDATQQAGGWAISARVKPDHLRSSGPIAGSVSGNATGSTTLPVNVVGSLNAVTLKLGNARMQVRFDLSVDLAGTVAVRGGSISFIGTQPGCVPTNNGGGNDGGPVGT